MNIKRILNDLILLTEEAGKAVLEIYNSDALEVENKADLSPLTNADKDSHQILMNGLSKYGLPVLSEEGKDIAYDERKNWELYWCIDPIDGTKEFIRKTGEFTINIGLISGSIPVFGIVYAPVLNKMYIGGDDVSPFCLNGDVKTELKHKVPRLVEAETVVVASRSHSNNETQEYINAIKGQIKLISMGSSLKFMLMAEGLANIYPRFVPTMEWDTAASHSILKALGYCIKTVEEEELEYNKEGLLNPSFVAQ
ncbi:3'(2'),5'-bisphosphate nucleotidase CysQ [uncultured Algibacter sp.]|uniref:3'(2'),5'-bisphosphate nucleotidase CysQ n=1 Tax=uncultured Algibacter sp. TaxID=298659 RepID=UPI002636A9AD|nr:3'(2'),5'-bisphosphate nucleotidase CysQ [uncultured Algibacter sp.]